jgi:hypothetical protein
MMTIRKVQLDSLATDRLTRLADDLHALVLEQPSLLHGTLGKKGSHDLITACIQRCLGAGFAGRATISRAVVSLFRHGERTLGDPERAMASIISELEAESFRSLLETLEDDQATTRLRHAHHR